MIRRPALITCLISDGSLSPENFNACKSTFLSRIQIAVNAGVSIVQIREKQLSTRMLFDLAAEVARIIKGSETLLLINDRADVEMLKDYGSMFGRVLRAGFGHDKRIRTTIYEVSDTAAAPPVHLVAVHLGWPEADDGVHFENVKTPDLIGRLIALAHQVERRSSDGRTIRRRVFHVYDTVRCGAVRVPSVFLGKPNLARYWTRSMAMRDADIVSADLLRLAAMRQRSRRARVV